MYDPDAVAQIRGKVRPVVANEAKRIAVALVLDRYDLLQRAWGTIAESIHRLGPVWTEAALRVQRHGWDAPNEQLKLLW
jgi:hypothetical protein